MPQEIFFPPWRTAQGPVQYPFADTALLKNRFGDSIQPDLIEDARIHPVGGGVGAYLRTIEVSDVTRLGIGDPEHGETCFAVFDPASPADDLPLQDAYGRPAGVLVSTIAKWRNLPSALVKTSVTFDAQDTPFVASVCIPMPTYGVSAFLLDDGTILSGEVWLIGNQGVVIRYVDGKIRVDVVGDPYWKIRECVESASPVPPLCGIKTINGILPSASGNFSLTPGRRQTEDPVIRITPDEDGLVIDSAGRAPVSDPIG